MDVEYLKDLIDKGYPAWATQRYRDLDFYDKFLAGEAYNVIPRHFHMEKDQAGNYIPLRSRRPSVRYNIPKIIANRSTRLLFGGNHWPRIDADDKNLTDYIQNIVDTSSIRQTMLNAAVRGSIGSVLVLFGYVEGKLVFHTWKGKYCTPRFDRAGTLTEVTIRYITSGSSLAAAGFRVDDNDIDKDFIYVKTYTKEEEIIYKPVTVQDYDPKTALIKDESFTHKLGFVPGVWIKNFPSADLDGDCAFKESLPFCIEIDYLLSQLGRGLKYNMDPQLVIKEPAGGTDEDESPGGDNNKATAPVRSTNNVIFTTEKGDAKILEINGTGHMAVLKTVELLRRMALEVSSASRKDPDKAYGNMSGRAMEILDEELISLAGVYRLTYGEEGLRPLIILVLKAANKLGLLETEVKDDTGIKLIWGAWYDPTPTDLQTTETALNLALKGHRLFDHEARQISANLWGVGHADPEKLAEQWPLPPESVITKDEKQLKLISRGPAAEPSAPAGNQGRTDAKVAG